MRGCRVGIILLLWVLSVAGSSAQLAPNSKAFLIFVNTENEESVDGADALGMLKSYVEGKTSLEIVNSKEEAEYILELSVVKKAMADRKGLLSVRDVKSNEVIFTSKWVRGTSNAFYGYSGTRHAIGKLVKKELIGAYQSIEKAE